MADSKISALTDGTPLQPSDEFVVARGGGNNKIGGEDVTAVLAREATTVDVTNTTTETDILNYSVPANELGSTRKLRVEMGGDYLNNNNITNALSLIVYYGGTTIYNDTVSISSTSASRRPWRLTFSLCANNATNAQAFFGNFSLGTSGGALTGIGDLDTDEIESSSPIFNTISVDSTAAQTLRVSFTWSTASANLSARRFHASVERV